jgi:hypothetical protein
MTPPTAKAVAALALLALTGCGNDAYPPVVFKAAEEMCAPYGGLENTSAWRTVAENWMVTAACIEKYTEVKRLVTP